MNNKYKTSVKAIVAVFFISLLGGNAIAQSQNESNVSLSKKGSNYVSLGIGIGATGFSGTGGLPVVASFEHAFNDKISAGVFVSFIKRKFGEDFSYSYYVIGARGSYNLNEVLKVDNERVTLYSGASLFYRGLTIKYKDEESDFDKAAGGSISLGVHAGGRYLLSKKLAAFGEFGYGVTPLEIGLALTF